MKFLDNPSQPKDARKQYQLPSRTSMANFLKQEHTRLFPDAPLEDSTEPPASSPKKVAGDKNKNDLRVEREVLLLPKCMQL